MLFFWHGDLLSGTYCCWSIWSSCSLTTCCCPRSFASDTSTGYCYPLWCKRWQYNLLACAVSNFLQTAICLYFVDKRSLLPLLIILLLYFFDMWLLLVDWHPMLEKSKGDPRISCYICPWSGWILVVSLSPFLIWCMKPTILSCMQFLLSGGEEIDKGAFLAGLITKV